jgi:hypothetical protein
VIGWSKNMNTLSTKTLPIKELSNGDQLSISVFHVRGELPGPTVYIQASVHGAEHQGNPVIFELLNYFKTHPIKGELTIVPCANPTSITQKVGTWTYGRFNPITGHNWNRNYTDLMAMKEQERGFSLGQFVTDHLKSSWQEIKVDYKKAITNMIAQARAHYLLRGPNENRKLNLILQELAADADIVLDLHTGPTACRYLYAAEFELESAKVFNFPLTLAIPPEFAGAMDEACFVPWWQLREEFKKQGREIPIEFEAFTVELGSEERISFAEAVDDSARLLGYLKYRGVIDSAPEFKKQKSRWSELAHYRTYYAPKGALYDFVAGPGTEFKKGQALARGLNFRGVKDFSTLSSASFEVPALEAGIVVNHTTSASLHEGAEMFQVMEELKEF